jgi:methionine salvage enolase-phosphatase E1
MNTTSKIERFLNKCERIAKKLGKVVAALSWIEKLYKNETVKAIAGRIWTLL